MLTAGEILAMRGVMRSALPDTAVIYGGTIVSDGGGGGTFDYVNGGTFDCRISPVGGGERGDRGDRISDESTHIITFPAETNITEASRVVIGSSTYEVTLVRERAAWELSLRVEAKEAP